MTTRRVRPSKTSEPANLLDFQPLAEKRLPKMVYDYYFGGANDEITLRENRAAYERLHLLPRVLVDVSHRDLSTTVLSQPTSMPVLIAPTGFQKMACPEGEVATARAAAESGTIMVLSTLSNIPLEEVASSSSGPKWFQLYVYKDRGITKSLVQRAQEAGYKAICMTVDTPLVGRRERDVRNSFDLPEGFSVANLTQHHGERFPTGTGQQALAAYIASLFDQSLTWKDIEWLSSITSLPVLVKGIHHPNDARLAVEHGAKGIIVSNHGARQLDTVPATIDMLPRIVEAVGDRLEVLVDGGVRRGTDVIKAIALGAKAVLIGRPILWGLAVDGQNGAKRVLELLRQEIDLAMALSGCTKLSEITRELVIKQ